MTNSRLERIIHWRKVFSDHETSGLNIAAFCQWANISKCQYYYWKRRVKNITGAVQNKPINTFKAQEFIQVPTLNIVQKHVHETAANAVEVRIGLISLFFHSNTDREVFKEAVSVLIEVAR